jgi:broad specificity phosphatase PhoE
MPARLVLIKHAYPVLDATVPAKTWKLGAQGEAEAQQLAGKLQKFLPFELVCSSEPKALRTAEVIGQVLGLAVTPQTDMHELDRPALPMMPDAEHQMFNARLFETPLQPVVGNESATAALERFSKAITTALSTCIAETLVVVSHGTVISLLVGQHNSVDSFALWKRLTCASYVVLDVPELTLIETHIHV